MMTTKKNNISKTQRLQTLREWIGSRISDPNKKIELLK